MVATQRNGTGAIVNAIVMARSVSLAREQKALADGRKASPSGRREEEKRVPKEDAIAAVMLMILQRWLC
jgi:hypothetical protein